ncbi:MAG TPA: LptF/LptG family permease [Chitinophagales bacterium]|nr:LptF/LptG family permease [Chitinophagales bacterium]
MRVKKLDWLVVKSFIGPFILTFCIAQFVLVMQFLWKYVDDLVGKGLDTWVLMELLMYASARLVPMALPLAVLLASIMTYGSFGEHYELTAVKSAGISLFRFMRSLIITVTLISIFAFFFSNNLLPRANLKFGALLYDIRHQKPTVALKPGIFYSGIDGFSIRAGEKDDETNTLYNITVYDHSSGKGNDHVITAKKGMMTQDDDALALTLKLDTGKQYREIDPKDNAANTYQMVNTQFSSWEKRFDLSQFKLNRTDENFFKDLKQMLNLDQLYNAIDTINIEANNLKQGYNNYIAPYFSLKKFGLDTLKNETKIAPVKFAKADDLLKEYDHAKRIQIMEIAMNHTRNIKNFSDVTSKQLEYKDRDLTSHMVEVYRKFTLSIACLVLFFIGAPLGSIIRKGGLGWPLFYSVLFFIVYHVTSIIGEKLSENNVLTIFAGMWLSTFILMPIGLFLTLKANSDSKLYSTDYYRNLFRKSTPKKQSA